MATFASVCLVAAVILDSMLWVAAGMPGCAGRDHCVKNDVGSSFVQHDMVKRKDLVDHAEEDQQVDNMNLAIIGAEEKKESEEEQKNGIEASHSDPMKKKFAKEVSLRSKKTFAGKRRLKETEAHKSRSNSCDDKMVNGQEWHDSLGDNCVWYEERNRCWWYGDKYHWGGLDADEACCVCGGGSCTNKKVDGQKWHDSEGEDCEYYINEGACEAHGDDRWTGQVHTANEACCVCGGGIV